MSDYSYIKNNIEITMERINKAAQKANRRSSEIQLLLATKTRIPEEINYAISLGFGLIGENRAQELCQKIDLIDQTPTQITPRETHFIGHLQGNKVNEVTQFSRCIQSVDRTRIARRIHNYCLQNHLQRDIFIQVNTSGETSKQGVDPISLFAFLEEISSFTTLNIRGFMTIGLHDNDPNKIRTGFSQLRELNDTAIQKMLINKNANELSMGMSQDLELAVLEGSTLLRIGSDIFGAR